MREISWTAHARDKMRHWQLSEGRVKRVMHSPLRIEEGIAEGTVAVMQRAGSEKHPYEIWVMVVDEPKCRKVISAWRYPGITKPGEPLPEEILREFRSVL